MDELKQHLHLGIVAHDVVAHEVQHLACRIDHDGFEVVGLLQFGQCVQHLLPAFHLQGGTLVRLVDA